MDGNYGNAVNQGLAGTGAIVADNGAHVAGTAIMNAAPGLGAATTAGVQNEWGNMVTGATQGIGGAVEAVNADVGQQIAGYGTAVGSATQYGLD